MQVLPIFDIPFQGASLGLNGGYNLPFSSPNHIPQRADMDYQTYMMFVINFYEFHMANFKTIILQQNETNSQQKLQIKVNILILIRKYN